ncbi:hypothetical protein LguiA_005142 [Lonicera macranthoides]
MEFLMSWAVLVLFYFSNNGLNSSLSLNSIQTIFSPLKILKVQFGSISSYNSN